ncbi:MAG: 1,4-alpha-glucan branching enzyme [Chlamydiae bacterium RIFCSPHIGHO2_12_FULL_44_59]|nr:MAG: 1,4-alpha-glucan branching enzyme [Chlamydiae bacterium RIFCSPHIGHO2_01_FULL_44_39]OGN58256.1 MAG: 1,4-alpha-glucan branching enzyme [Chlamydiae bacterium RIFCSPHIGHO2_02_FULL_45_9]OGN60846.1 MAG: 1,4-alpha-glucan branching enzyme [Chlamydiae bacterium RIFCSPHIGHO2_12_FULL_44_59]OGN66722.1 MAG: 1,4-alpha-glucan branching enzyme [Chlamydiae bacterium RIFCSPLOWO2_01_FULL_44_52]OGN67372.1 MAG: 1,4-alpha-glucan branching enzyme [Chlamydiae bacterium RIFCSPLOWO2_02_FULL_45_22]OGN70647.1 MAG
MSTAKDHREWIRLKEGRATDPHAFLGLHEGGRLIRFWSPGSGRAKVEVWGTVYEMQKKSDTGLFELLFEKPLQPENYRIFHPSGLVARDPYVEAARVTEQDSKLFQKGLHYEIYQVLGATVEPTGVRMAVWAPHAKSVYLKGDFNRWNGLQNPMRRVGDIWELFLPGLGEGERYQFDIHTKEGCIREKSDPLAFFSALRPKTESICFDLGLYTWGDQGWNRRGLKQPINIYEVHLGSWRRYEGEFPKYREIAIDLAKYCKEMGFSHVELLPIMEHPLDESWGYQVTGFFSSTSRYGTPRDFQFFVDHMHQEGIGVILDWVPGHFPMDEFSLSQFDGSPLYEYEDARMSLHPHWHTAVFNYGRKEVTNFLIASALFWHEKFHIDGIRVDAVASILYLDYGRKEGEWIPNSDGTNINYEAVEFLKHLNQVVHERFPGTLMFAEESTTFSGVTHSDGLGFDLKWNMGWMNDTLRYFSKEPQYRKFYQEELTFSLHYAFTENFACVLSHDEVVHEKKSILAKMPGSDEEKFANVRLLYSYMLCHPGKNLIFMGAEIGQWREWSIKGVLNWELLKYPLHQGLQQCFKDFNFFYRKSRALWEKDYTWKGYEWIDDSTVQNGVLSYVRTDGKEKLICIHNFSPTHHARYFVALENVQGVREVLNTDAAQYGGANQLNHDIEIKEQGFYVRLAGLATLICEID